MPYFKTGLFWSWPIKWPWLNYVSSKDNQHIATQVLYIKVKYSALHYGLVQCNAIHWCSAYLDAGICLALSEKSNLTMGIKSLVQCSSAQRSAVQLSTVQRSAVKRSMVQRSTVQHSAVKRSVV